MLNPDASAVDITDMRDNMHDNQARAFAPNIFCRSCASPLVQADSWEQEEDLSWGVRLWCPECGFEQAAVLDKPQLLYLSMAVEEGFAWILEALAQLNSLTVTRGELDLVERAQTDRIDPVPR